MQSESLQMIEHEAAKGNKLPKDLRPPEVMLYYMLSGLYARYQSGKISKPDAKQHKQEIYNTYHKLTAEYEQFLEVCREYQNRLRNGYQVSGVNIIEKE